MLSQLKMNPDPAYQNRLLPERDNASLHLRLNLKLLHLAFQVKVMLYFPVWIEKQVKEWQSD